MERISTIGRMPPETNMGPISAGNGSRWQQGTRMHHLGKLVYIALLAASGMLVLGGVISWFGLQEAGRSSETHRQPRRGAPHER